MRRRRRLPVALLSTFNTASFGTGVTFSSGDLVAAYSAVSEETAKGARGRAVGRHYFEMRAGGAGDRSVGLVTAAHGVGGSVYASANAVGWRRNGDLYVQGVSAGSLGAYADSDTICVAVDFAALDVWFRKGGAGDWNNSGAADPATGAGGIDISGLAATLFPAASAQAGTAPTWRFNGGSAPPSGPIPAGFNIWE